MPQTEITYHPSAGVTVKAPKDVSIEEFKIGRDANGKATLEVGKYQARMNPDVIAAQSARDKVLIETTAKAVTDALGASAAAAASGVSPIPIPASP